MAFEELERRYAEAAAKRVAIHAEGQRLDDEIADAIARKSALLEEIVAAEAALDEVKGELLRAKAVTE